MRDRRLLGCLGLTLCLSFSGIGCGGELFLRAPKKDDGNTSPSGDVDQNTGTASGGGDADVGTDPGNTSGDVTDPGDTDTGTTDPGDTDTGSTDPGDADTGDTAACPDGQTAICHIPSDDPSAAHVICVDDSAAGSLEEHGDMPGDCPDGIGNDPGDTDPSAGDPGTMDPGTTDPGDTSYACGDDGGKTLVCHAANGKDPRTLCVGSPAAGAHLDHGDLPGPCEQ